MSLEALFDDKIKYRAMYFENKEIDPRDCQYKANPKIRKQIEQVIRANKIKYGLIGGKQPTDDYAIRKSQTKSLVKNRFNKSATKKDDLLDDSNKENLADDNDELQNGFSNEKIVTFIEQLDLLMSLEDEKKQPFGYQDLVKMHQLLQYLEDEEDKDVDNKMKKDSTTKSFRSQYFFQFMEDHFRVIQPEKRKNAVLDERIRKLKYQAASKDYDTMTANVSRVFRGSGPVKSGSANSSFTLSQELRNVRSTLIATGNAFMVIFATFAFFYIAFGYARPDATTANRVLFSFSASMVVAVAEIYFLIRII